MPLRDFVDPWLSALENQGRKPTTLRGYRTSLDAYVLPRLGDVALQELRASDLDALYAELLRSGGRCGQGLSMTTVHHVHAALNKLLHDAERKGLVIRNVAKLANAPSLTTARAKGPEMRVWSPDELARFLASIEGNRNEALFRLMAMTGIRRGEVVALRWSDVELAGHRLTVNQAATVMDGEEVVAVPKTTRATSPDPNRWIEDQEMSRSPLEPAVAIKHVDGGKLEATVEAWSAEAQAMAACSCPNLVQIRHAEVTRSGPVLVMDYLPDGSWEGRHRGQPADVAPAGSVVDAAAAVRSVLVVGAAEAIPTTDVAVASG